MNKVSNAPENIFRLLVPATDIANPGAAFIELCGKPWVLVEFERISDAPPYTCISYSWGDGETNNMLDDGNLMSDRTLPVIETTIKVSQSTEHLACALKRVLGNKMTAEEKLAVALNAAQAIWIDALCVPYREPARAACLRSMGAIYKSAAQVFAVLPSTCAHVLHKINNGQPLEHEDLLAVESHDWITRAWTYQETANSQITFLLAQDDGSAIVHQMDFLNALVTDTADYADKEKIERTKLAVLFPRLDSFQELFAEQRLAEYSERSAYQVMSSMQSRFAKREEDLIYAMIGVVTDLPSDSQVDPSIQPAEYFMRVCEAKGDYSFIYCTSPRSEVPGRTWRPVGDKFQPLVFGYLAVGSGLSGCQKATHLQLDKVCRMKPGTIRPDALKAANGFLQRVKIGPSQTDIASALLECLRRKGFSGCGDFLELEDGYFFPQSAFSRLDEIFVIASEGVEWGHSGPGLLVRSNGTDINQFCDVGVFVGRFPTTSESINVG